MKNLKITRNGVTLFRTVGASMSRSTATNTIKKIAAKRILKSVYRIFKTIDDGGNECYVAFIGSKRELA